MTTANSEIKILNLPDGRIALLSPYHPEVPSAAKALGGRWNSASKSWSFDSRDTNAVRALCTRVFGVDPLADAPIEAVTVRVGYPLFESAGSALWLFGRELAKRFGRDRAVSLGNDVIILQGGFPSRGGSVKSPALMADNNTILEVRDVPRLLAEALVAELDAEVTKRDANLATAAPGSWAQHYADRAHARRAAIELLDAPTTTTAPDQVAHILNLIHQLSPDDQARLRVALRVPAEAH